MSPSRTLFLGMDVHKDAIAVASVAQEHGAEGLSLGTIGTRQWALAPRLRQRQAQATHLVGVYAAGPWGAWLSRSLMKTDDDCWVVAPSLMPQQAGAGVTTDRRDAMPLARLARSGALPPVHVPPVADEAMRDLRRARDDALGDRKTAKGRLPACLLRHDIRYTGRATWGPAHLRWLSAVLCPTPAPQMVCQESVRAVTAHPARLQRLAHALQEQGKAWRFPPVVDARQALRGVPFMVAGTTVAALGDLTRFENPRQLRKCLGAMPSA